MNLNRRVNIDCIADINECLDSSTHNCMEANNEVCINNEGSFICECQTGFERLEASQTCEGTVQINDLSPFHSNHYKHIYPCRYRRVCYNVHRGGSVQLLNKWALCQQPTWLLHVSMQYWIPQTKSREFLSRYVVLLIKQVPTCSISNIIILCHHFLLNRHWRVC